MLLRISFKTCAVAILLVSTCLVGGIPAQAGTIGLTYNFAGTLLGPPVISGGVLTVTGAGSGRLDEGNPLADAAWNPVTFDTIDHVNLATGVNNGTFTMIFADGDTLSGVLFEDDSMVDTATATGTFTQTLTFTAGTGQFAGITGSSFGGGSVIAGVYTETGSGTLTAPALAPEPESILLLFGGVAFIALRFRQMPMSRKC